MKFTFSWLKDHLKTDLKFSEILDVLNNIGLEVENALDRSKDFKPFSVGYITKAEKHPNADRLKICYVKTNKGILQVVCGAPNARTGMKGIFAPEGSYIPGTGITLNKAVIRGVESFGMLVSEKEMGISGDHESIIEIDNSYKIGEKFSNIFGFNDPIIEIAITPNRGDCLSVMGIARDLAAAGAGKIKKVGYPFEKGTFKSSVKWMRTFNKKNENLCSLVSGRYFRNVKNGESPDWLKKRLIAIGLRPISKLVDITNYITHDLGRPLHVFDADKIKGNLFMRMAKKNESIKALDGQIYKLDENMTVISDNDKVHAIGGVMGGEFSGCSEQTVNVFLEVALFDPISISKTGRKLNLQSDARYRFERGLDPNSVELGLNAATKMIKDLCGGEISEISSSGINKIPKKIINFSFDKVEKIGGIKINKNYQKKIFTKLGFKSSKEKNNKCEITIPSFRTDIDGEADLVEEVIRIYGYNKIKPLEVLKTSNDLTNPLNSKQSAKYKAKRLIASRGYFELITWSFISSKFAKHFNPYKNLLKLDNPISSDLDVMRPSILPNLLKSINENKSRFIDNTGIFEVGPQYENHLMKGQHTMASGIKYGFANPINWNDINRSVDIFDIKSDVYFLLSSLDIPLNNIKLIEKTPNWYHPGKSASLILNKNTICYFGEINPKILKMYEINGSVCAFEIFLDYLGEYQINKEFNKISYIHNSLQAIERDFAFIVDINIQSSKILEVIHETQKEIIRDINIFDVFEGGSIPIGKKSIAIKIIFQPKKTTFTENEIDQISNEIIKRVNDKTGGQIRK